MIGSSKVNSVTTSAAKARQSPIGVFHRCSCLIDKHPRLWATLVLWIASCIFVFVFSTFAKWETGAHYSSMADLCKWDCNWFGSVLSSGYDRLPAREGGDKANWLFHPLLPLAAYPLNKWVGFSTEKSLVIASKAALFLSIYAFLLMISEEAGS